jgi:predicted nuclease of predicted toxin-antitoxin system
VKLLLDEMWSPMIAQELRRRGFDAVAIAEPEISNRYGGLPDDEVFAMANADGRVVVTDNVADFERVRLEWEEKSQPYQGLIYALDPPFNRHRGAAVIGQMVAALSDFLTSREGPREPRNRTYFLQPWRDT